MNHPPESPPLVTLRCEGCGAEPPPLAERPYPFTCASAGTDTRDHLLAPNLDVTRAVWPAGEDDRPFVKYRGLLHAHAAALSLGIGDDGYRQIVDRLDASLIKVDGRSFRTTPLMRSPGIESAVGGGAEIWIKDDTNNVSGSHKGRHLFGVLLHLEIVRAAGLEPREPPLLAIASCGNAALAAAVCARAADRKLAVMVPPDAHPNVLARLRSLGADVRIFARGPGELGDPTVTAFRRAVSEGALPFACQGTECGITLDGGKTLGYELASSGVPFDRVFVQVGGGALASSLFRALTEARYLGAIRHLPRLMPVQTRSVWPLARAYESIVNAIRARLPEKALPPKEGDALADALRSPEILPIATSVLEEVSRDRAAWLPVWDAPEPSHAHGILDDETYDALAILRGVLLSGGTPIVAEEPTVIESEHLTQTSTQMNADATGTSGLAGLLTWTRTGHVITGEKIALLFTGIRR